MRALPIFFILAILTVHAYGEADDSVLDRQQVIAAQSPSSGVRIPSKSEILQMEAEWAVISGSVQTTSFSSEVPVGTDTGGGTAQ